MHIYRFQNISSTINCKICYLLTRVPVKAIVVRSIKLIIRISCFSSVAWTADFNMTIRTVTASPRAWYPYINTETQTAAEKQPRRVFVSRRLWGTHCWNIQWVLMLPNLKSLWFHVILCQLCTLSALQISKHQ